MSDFEAQIAEAVGRVITNAFNWPAPIRAHLRGLDLAEPIDRITAALAPVIADAQAEVLREAAEELVAGEPLRRVSRGSLAEWLDARADRMEGQ